MLSYFHFVYFLLFLVFLTLPHSSKLEKSVGPLKSTNSSSIAESIGRWNASQGEIGRAQARICYNEVGGFEEVNGERRKICIGVWKPKGGGDITVGKFNPDVERCYFLKNGTEYQQTKCRYVKPSNGMITWVGATGSSIPVDAVPIKAGSNVHACRIAHQGNVIIGTWKKGESQCRAVFEKKELASQHFEIRARTRLSILLAQVRS